MKRWWAFVSLGLAIVTILGSFTLTDDEWPFAPFRMFSLGNNPNGIVQRMILKGDTASGRHLTLPSSDFGLRRAELEEQTPWNRWVQNDRIADLVAVYNSRHDDKLLHAQVMVYATQMHNGEKVGNETSVVIGDWAAASWTGHRAKRTLPYAPPWPGYSE